MIRLASHRAAIMMMLITVLAVLVPSQPALAAGANLVVPSVYWGMNQNSGLTAHPGDVNLPLTVLLANTGDDIARDVKATLLLQPPFVYTYYEGERKLTADRVTRSTGDLSPGVTFPLIFNLDVASTAKEGLHRTHLQLEYKSAQQLSVIRSQVDLDVPVWRGDLRVLRVATVPLKIYPGDTEVNLKVVVGNSGLGATKNLEVRLDLKPPFSSSSSGSDRLLIGILAPGAAVEANFFIDIAKAARFGEYEIEILASTDSQAPTRFGVVTIHVHEKARLEIVSLSPNVLTPGQLGAIVRVIIRNVAGVEAESVRVQLKPGNFLSGTLTDFLGSLEPSEEKTAFLKIDVDGAAPEGNLRMDLRLDWTQGQSALSDTLTIDMTIGARAFTDLIAGGAVIFAIIVIVALVLRRRRTHLASKAKSESERIE